uniref:Uncharacterized protein n=1 Tax=Oryza punctata TaxID=4537 RepID=A0A0E0LM18_ORYPU
MGFSFGSWLSTHEKPNQTSPAMDIVQSHAPSRFLWRMRHAKKAMMAISRTRIKNLFVQCHRMHHAPWYNTGIANLAHGCESPGGDEDIDAGKSTASVGEITSVNGPRKMSALTPNAATRLVVGAVVFLSPLQPQKSIA